MQLDYGQYPAELSLGRIADTSLRQIDSFSAEGVVGIAKALIRGTNPQRQTRQAGTGAGQGALVVGISVFTQTLEQAADGSTAYADKFTVPVMRKGRIVVQTESAVTAGREARLVLATGNFTDAAASGTVEAFTLIKASFVTSTTAAGLAILEIQNAI